MRLILLILAAVFGYLLLWPVPVSPIAWEAPAAPTTSGPWAVNERLAGLQRLPIGAYHGPEDIALDAEGRLYTGTGEGVILRLGADGSGPERWADTGGRPLGIEFDASGRLIVADAFLGLLAVAPDGAVSVLADEAGGVPIRYADDLDIAPDGRIYFSDASVKFGAEAFGGTLPASLLDLVEHGGHGRLLEYDPATMRVRVLMEGLDFANGVALTHDGRAVLVNETGSYRVVRHWLSGARAGQHEVLLDNLPGFPDNLSRGREGRYWLGLASPRNATIDALSGYPFLRRMLMRLPAFMRPAPVRYGHVIAFDDTGRVLASLQDPAGHYPMTTGVTETADRLYISSLQADAIATLPAATISQAAPPAEHRD